MNVAREAVGRKLCKSDVNLCGAAPWYDDERIRVFLMESDRRRTKWMQIDITLKSHAQLLFRIHQCDAVGACILSLNSYTSPRDERWCMKGDMRTFAARGDQKAGWPAGARFRRWVRQKERQRQAQRGELCGGNLFELQALDDRRAFRKPEEKLSDLEVKTHLSVSGWPEIEPKQNERQKRWQPWQRVTKAAGCEAEPMAGLSGRCSYLWRFLPRQPNPAVTEA